MDESERERWLSLKKQLRWHLTVLPKWEVISAAVAMAVRRIDAVLDSKDTDDLAKRAVKAHGRVSGAYDEAKCRQHHPSCTDWYGSLLVLLSSLADDPPLDLQNVLNRGRPQQSPSDPPPADVDQEQPEQ